MAKKEDLPKALQKVVAEVEKQPKTYKNFAFAFVYKPTKQLRQIDTNSINDCGPVHRRATKGYVIYVVESPSKSIDPSEVRFREGEMPENVTIIDDFNPNGHFEPRTNKEEAE